MAQVETRERRGAYAVAALVTQEDSLFDRFSWLYAFCREYLFRDDTRTIAHALWPRALPSPGQTVLELGCGPGVYARRLARLYAHLDVTGVDRSDRQLKWARAAAGGVSNCRFERGDVHHLACATGTVHAVVASRLLTVVAEPALALGEMYRVLRPGGRCFIAEPRSALRAGIPLRAMWLLARLPRARHYGEPPGVMVLGAAEFDALLRAQPWGAISIWGDARYQYAVCEKGDAGAGPRLDPMWTLETPV